MGGGIFGLIASLVLVAMGTATLAIRIPQSRRIFRLQALRRQGAVAYLTRRNAHLAELARVFAIQDPQRLQWEFLIRVTPEGWTFSNSDLVARAFLPWSAIGPIRLVDDADTDKVVRNVHVSVAVDDGHSKREVELFLLGWGWAAYPKRSDPSVAPIDVASVALAVRELESLRTPRPATD